jgi:hypothetical protein
MSQNKKLKVAMQLVLAVSAAGVATVLHNAPASASYNWPMPDGTNVTLPSPGEPGYDPNQPGASTALPGAGQYVAPDFTGTDGLGQPRKNISGQAKAQILTQVASTNAGTIDFGKVVPSAASGTITINADGTLTNAGGARYIPNSGATVATLSFSGEPNQNIQIDTPSSATIANGASTMTVNFNYPPLPTAIGASGNVAMNYGGTLNVGANQAAGIYTGTYDIYVTYVV